jgi:hypothetical protein
MADLPLAEEEEWSPARRRRRTAESFFALVRAGGSGVRQASRRSAGRSRELVALPAVEKGESSDAAAESSTDAGEDSCAVADRLSDSTLDSISFLMERMSSAERDTEADEASESGETVRVSSSSEASSQQWKYQWDHVAKLELRAQARSHTVTEQESSPTRRKSDTERRRGGVEIDTPRAEAPEVNDLVFEGLMMKKGLALLKLFIQLCSPFVLS